MNVEKLTAYELIKKEELPDINSTGYLLRHNKTKARVVVIENDERNKVLPTILSRCRSFRRICSCGWIA